MVIDSKKRLVTHRLLPFNNGLPRVMTLATRIQRITLVTSITRKVIYPKTVLNVNLASTILTRTSEDPISVPMTSKV